MKITKIAKESLRYYSNSVKWNFDDVHPGMDVHFCTVVRFMKSTLVEKEQIIH